MKKKIALLMACVMAFGVAVGSTLAWLTDKTDAVVNTFTESDIDITLVETDADKDGKADENAYKMIPGYEIAKDPVVTVVDGSEDCYIFVKVVEANNTISGLAADPTDANSAGKVLLYSVDRAWTKLKGVTGVDNVYYQTVTGLAAEANTANWSDNVLANDKVVVNQNVTKTMMDGTLTTDHPTLSFVAAAIQLNKTNGTPFAADEAYGNLPDAFKNYPNP